jgi:hypothetical protein
MKKLFITAAIIASLGGPALANQCPTLMGKIDEAMKTATLDDATKAKVTELYAKGKAEHEGGDHAASEASLGEAMKLMGMEKKRAGYSPAHFPISRRRRRCASSPTQIML